jgi:hypothetical protein
MFIQVRGHAAKVKNLKKIGIVRQSKLVVQSIERRKAVKGRNLEEQMRLSLRAILSKHMTSSNGSMEAHRVITSFVSDESGFPLTGLKRSGNRIADMEVDEFEQMSAIIPQIWEQCQLSLEGLDFVTKEVEEGEVNHLTIGFKKKEEASPHLELMVTRLDELFLSSIYYAKEKKY